MDSLAPQLKKYRPQTSQTTGAFVYLWKPILTGTRVEQKNRYAKYSFSDDWRSNRLKTEKTT